MKIMNISPLSFFFLVTLISPHKTCTAEPSKGDEQGVAYPNVDSIQTAYRSTGPLPIPQPSYFHPSAPPGNYPPTYTTEDRRISSSEVKSPPSAYFSDSSYSPHHAQFPPYSYPPQPIYYPPAHPYPPQAGAMAPPPSGLPVEKRGHTRQRSSSLNLGDLSLGTDTDTSVQSLAIPRQLADSFEAFQTERDLLLAAVQTFLNIAKEEGKAVIEGFEALTHDKGSPMPQRKDSLLETAARKLQSKDALAQGAQAQRRKELLAQAEPFNRRVDTLAAQCARTRTALEEATGKLKTQK